MAIDPNIIGSHVPAPTGFSPLKAISDAGKYADEQQKRRDDQAERENQAVIQAVMQQTPEDPDTAIKTLKQRGFFGAATGLQKIVTEQRTKQSELDTKELTNRASEAKLLRDSLGDNPTPESWRQTQIKLGGKSPDLDRLLNQPFTPELGTFVANFARTNEDIAKSKIAAIQAKSLEAWIDAFNKSGPEADETQKQAAFYMGPKDWAAALTAAQNAQTNETRAAIDMVQALKPASEKGGTSDYAQFLSRYAASKNKTVDQLTSAEELDAKKQWGRADDAAQRGLAPIIIQTGSGPQLVDRGSGTARNITDAAGNVIGQAPTADMRNKVAARQLVGKSIDAIKGIGDKILTRVGPGQRVEALKRGASAVFGNDPEFKTYQDARMALAGNLAVGQQGSRPSDADIKAIWLPLVPDAYSDTKESSEMKWRLIKTMSDTEIPSAGGASKMTAEELIKKYGGK